MRDLLFYGRLVFIVVAVLVYGAFELGFFSSEPGSQSVGGGRLILMDGGR